MVSCLRACLCVHIPDPGIQLLCNTEGHLGPSKEFKYIPLHSFQRLTLQNLGTLCNKMNLCTACDSFARALYVGERPYMKYKLYDQVSDLLSSAATCRLCQLIVSLPLCSLKDGKLDDRKLFLFACVKFLLLRSRPCGYLVRTRYSSSYVILEVARFNNNTQGVSLC